MNKAGHERLFIAVSVPDHVSRYLKQFQSKLKMAGIHASWTQEANMHLTLKFLGDTPSEARNELPQRLQAVVNSIPPFSICAGGLGVFPTVKKPRVLWSKVKGDTQILQSLYDHLETELAHVGFERDKKPFHPHFTVGRVKSRVSPEVMFELIDRFSTCHSTEFSVTGIHLFKSDLSPKGVVHTHLFKAEFSQGSKFL